MRLKIAVVLLSLLPFFAFSEKLIVVSDTWEGYTSEDGTGYYIDVLKAAMEPLGYEVDFKAMPYARSLKEIANKKADVVLGTYEGDEENAIYATFSVEIDTVDAFVRAGDSAGFNVNDWFNDKKIGGQIGYSFQETFGFGGTYKESSELDTLVKQLYGKRIDVILDYEVDVVTAANDANLEIKFEVIKDVFASKIQNAFQNNAKGEKIRNEFDNAMQSLHDSGELRKIMIKHLGSDATYPL